MKRLVFFALAVLAPLSALAGPLTVKGSDTMVILGQRWAEDVHEGAPRRRWSR